MFSIDANPIPNLPARNPRRRQRTGSDDSIVHRHSPKRLRRSGLSSETSLPPPGKYTNGYANHIDGVPHANGHATDPKGRRDASVDTASLAIRDRASKKVEREKRGGRSEGSIELVRPNLSTHLAGLMVTISNLDQKCKLHRHTASNDARTTVQ